MESELIMGRNPVFEALRSNREINKLWVNEGSRGGQMNELIELAKKNGVLIQFVPKQKLDRLVNQGNHQGVVASIAAYNYAGMDTLSQRAEALNAAPFLLLHDATE